MNRFSECCTFICLFWGALNIQDMPTSWHTIYEFNISWTLYQSSNVVSSSLDFPILTPQPIAKLHLINHHTDSHLTWNSFLSMNHNTARVHNEPKYSWKVLSDQCSEFYHRIDQDLIEDHINRINITILQ